MSSPRRVVVDDTDSRVIYIGEGWLLSYGDKNDIGNWGPTYQHTSHGTMSSAELSFTFEGTSITLYGTYQPPIDGLSLSWECFVDDISFLSATFLPKADKAGQNHVVLCERLNLQDATHKFSLKVTTTGAPFWVDSLQFTPSPHTPMDETVVLVQNTDPEIILDSSWTGLKRIVNVTSATGSKATFKFVGRSLTWIGSLPTNLPNAPASGSFSIDGGPATKFDIMGSPAGVYLYNQELFTISNLEPTPHTLVVTYDGPDGLATPLALDYLYITSTTASDLLPPNALSSSSLSSSAVSDVSTKATTLSSSTVSSTSTETSSTPIISSSADVTKTPGASSIAVPSTSPNASQTSIGLPQRRGASLPIGAIIGGSIGGLTLIILISLLLLWHQRRRRCGKTQLRSRGRKSHKVTPFMSTAALVLQAEPSDDVIDIVAPREMHKSPLPTNLTIEAVRRDKSGLLLP